MFVIKAVTQSSTFVSPQGELLWCSPVQDPLKGILSDEQREVVITTDSQGLVKTWRAQTGEELASFPTASSHCTLLQYNIDNDWFLTVSNHKDHKVQI